MVLSEIWRGGGDVSLGEGPSRAVAPNHRLQDFGSRCIQAWQQIEINRL